MPMPMAMAKYNMIVVRQPCIMSTATVRIEVTRPLDLDDDGTATDADVDASLRDTSFHHLGLGIIEYSRSSRK